MATLAPSRSGPARARHWPANCRRLSSCSNSYWKPPTCGLGSPTRAIEKRRRTMHGTPEQFAAEWIATWNAGDLDALLAHYSEDVTFTSPRAAAITGSAVVRGKDALWAYWSAAIQ